MSLEFVEPESVTLTATQDDGADLAHSEGTPAEGAPAPDATSEITVSMGPARDAEREA